MSEIELEALGEGVGLLSSLFRLRLAYARGTGPNSVIVKIPSLNETNRNAAVSFHCYEREVRSYLHLAAATNARTPRIYLADIEGEAEFVLVMEDLGSYDLGDQILGASPEQARLVIDAIHQFHAPFWERTDEADYEFIPYHYPSYFSKAIHEGTIAAWDTMAELAGEAVPPELTAAKDRYIAAIPGLQRWIAEPPCTIVQGDFRMDNMFFGTGPAQHPIVISDFQGILRGKGAHDVAYFLSQSLPVETRRKYERGLVAQWQAGLEAAGVEDYPTDRAWEDYRRAALVLWTYVVVIAGGFDPSNERGRELMVEIVRRSATTIIDLELLDLLPEFE